MLPENYNVRCLTSDDIFQISQQKNQDDNQQQVITNYIQLKLNDLLEQVGNEGIYQKYVLLTFCFAQFFYAQINFATPYVFYVPDYYCYESDGSLYKCRQDQACSNQFGYEVKSLRESLVTDYKLYCEDSIYYLRSQSALFFFGALIQFLSGFLADFIGRKTVLNLFSIMYILALIFYFSGNTFMCYILTYFMLYALFYSFVSVIYVYLPEVMGSKIKNFTGGLGSLCFVIGQYFLLLVSKFLLSYKDILVMQLVCLFAIQCIFFFLIESPFYFYRKKNLLQTYNSLSKIAETNQDENSTKKIKLILQEKLGLKGQNLEKLKKYEIKKLPDRKLTFTRNLVNKFTKHDAFYLIGTSLVLFQTFCVASIILNYPQYLGVDNLYINIFFIGFGDIVAYINITFNGSKMPRKKTVFVVFITEVILGIFLFSLKLLGLRHIFIFKVLQLFIAFITRILVCTVLLLGLIWTAEIFPTRIRGIVMGVSLFFARLSFSITPYFIYYSVKYDLNPLSFIVLLTIIPVIYIHILPETVNAKLSN